MLDITLPCYLHPIYLELENKVPGKSFPALPGRFHAPGHLIQVPRNSFMGKGNQYGLPGRTWKKDFLMLKA